MLAYIVVKVVLTATPSREKLGVELWEFDSYATAAWSLPPLVEVESIDCHVGRQTINLRSTKVWATVPLQQVSHMHTDWLGVNAPTAWFLCLDLFNIIFGLGIYITVCKKPFVTSNRISLQGTTKPASRTIKKYYESSIQQGDHPPGCVLTSPRRHRSPVPSSPSLP